MTKPQMRHAIVTGSSSGIGKAIAERLLRDGWRVTGIDLATAVIRHDHFDSIRTDLANRAETEAAAAQVVGAMAFVHAAGIMRGAKLGALDHGVGDLLWRIHVEAAAVLADALSRHMGDGGRIVLIGSRAAQGVVAKSQYGAVKAALVGLARSWAKEVVARGITVNVVAPAATETAMLSDPSRTIIPPETPPLGRRIKPEEIAALVAFLCSPEAAAITGQEISICGGASL